MISWRIFVKNMHARSYRETTTQSLMRPSLRRSGWRRLDGFVTHHIRWSRKSHTKINSAMTYEMIARFSLSCTHECSGLDALELAAWHKSRGDSPLCHRQHQNLQMFRSSFLLLIH